MLAYISGEAFDGQPLPASVTSPALATSTSGKEREAAASAEVAEDEKEALRKRLK